jgi:HSP20 family protein
LPTCRVALSGSKRAELRITGLENSAGWAAELPGLDDKDFEVTVAGDLLTFKGEKKSEHEQRNGVGH